jgi:hypothetical protein
MRSPEAAMTLLEPQDIPSDAQTLKIPHMGEVLVFRSGADWRAIPVGAQASRTGVGATRLDAIADLLMAD